MLPQPTVQAKSTRTLFTRKTLLLTMVLTAGSTTLGAAEKPSKWSRVRNWDYTVKRSVLSFRDVNRQNLVTQGLDYSCGAAALATITTYFWGDDLGELDFIKIALQNLTPEEFKDRQKNGLTLEDLKNMAIKAGYFSTVGRLKFDQLQESKVPLIVGLDVEGYKHFVVLRGTDDDYVYIADSIRGNMRIRHLEFQQQWQKGLVLVVAKRSTTPPENAPLSVKETEKSETTLQSQVIRRSYLIPSF